MSHIKLKEKAKYIQNLIHKITDFVNDKQSKTSWQTVNKVRRRKSTVKSKLRSLSQKEQIHFCQTTFREFTWKTPNGTNESITKNITTQLDIS